MMGIVAFEAEHPDVALALLGTLLTTALLVVFCVVLGGGDR